jgi:hypothetical protein
MAGGQEQLGKGRRDEAAAGPRGGGRRRLEGREEKNYCGSGTMYNGKNPNPTLGWACILID